MLYGAKYPDTMPSIICSLDVTVDFVLTLGHHPTGSQDLKSCSNVKKRRK